MNTNFQTIHQFGSGISQMVRQATGRDSVESMEMDWVSVEQQKKWVYGEAEGNPAHFITTLPDGIMSLLVGINPVQDLNGQDAPSPSNICPISGWTECNLTIANGDDDTAADYDSDTFTLEFPDSQTVYGGTLNPITGVLTVDRVLFAFKDLVALNGASANWVYNSTYNLFETQNAIIPTGTVNTETGIVCSCYQSRPYGYNSSYSSENSIVWAHTSGALRIKDNRYTDVDVWKTAIADEQIVIPIATPIEIQLDPITVQTFIGDNYISADTGPVSVEYKTEEEVI